jgi:hypothetical protein
MSNAKTEERKLPSHRIYSVTKNGDEKAVWFEIGSCWKHKDGRGFSLQFRAIPLPGADVVLREVKAQEADGDTDAAT